MGIRWLALASALIALTPGVSAAQAVPPAKKPLMGPPVDYAGERAAPTPAIPPGGPTIGPPRAAPPPTVIRDDGKSRSERVATGLEIVGSSATLLEDGAKAIGSSGIAGDAKMVGVGAKVVGLAPNFNVMMEKCRASDNPGCAEQFLKNVSDYAGLAETMLDTYGGGFNSAASNAISTGSSLTGAYSKCYDEYGTEKFNYFECAAKLADSGVSGISAVAEYTGVGAPAAKAIGATYSIAKSVLPAAVDELGYRLLDKSWGEAIYDAWRGDDDNAAMERASREQAAKLERMRAQRRAAYQQTASALAQKQQSYDAEQARIAEQHAAAAAAQARAQAEYQNAMATQAAINNTVAQLQRAFAPPPPPAAGGASDSSDGGASDSSDGGCGGLGPGTCR